MTVRISPAFTLPELLAVLAILAALMAVGIPAANSSIRGSRLTHAGQSILDELNLARQQAISRNTTVEVRFYKLPEHGKPSSFSPRTVYRAIQLFLQSADGSATPIRNPFFLPAPVVIAAQDVESALLFSSRHPQQAGESAPPLGEFGHAYDFRSVYFGADGSVDLSNAESYFTLILQNDRRVQEGGNYFTLQIHPISGTVRRFRP